MSATPSCSGRFVRSWRALLCALLVGCGEGPAEPGSGLPRPVGARVFAAASIAPVCVLVAESRGATVQMASSSTLAQQVRAGARADVFVSAHSEWIDLLEREGRVVPGSRREFARTDLVLVRRAEQSAFGLGPRLGPTSAVGAAFSGRFAIGDPEHVPLGRYAKEALAALGLWESLEARLAPAADARLALNLVARGECDLGVVYRTDAVAAGVAIAIEAEIPGAAVVYEACRLTDSAGSASQQVDAYWEALFGEPGRVERLGAGFELPAAAQVPR